MLDDVFRDIHTRGVGAQAQQKEAFTKDNEDYVWEDGVLGSHSQQCLLDTVFWYKFLFEGWG